MKISLNWLSDFVEFKERNPEVIAAELTARMGEVDKVETQGALLKHCVVGKVANIRKHPGADKLNLCDVQTDRGTKKIVCGGTNLHDGMLVAFAHIGATVKWHGGELMTLAPVKIRGEQSEGMVCAAEEIGLQDMFPPAKADGERPVVNLSTLNLKIGTPLAEALGLNDVIFHIDNHAITHRPDLFSHVGIARELVAMGLAKWKQKQGKPAKFAFAKKTLPFACKNEIPKLIPRYCGCLLEIERVGETPEWMKRRLIATGWRPVSLPVDITNYVSMELGMPLHSFDADDLKGTVRMRTAKKGEKITTLDGIERPLNEGAIVLADDMGIFDLLGVMGGLRSSTKDTTRHIYLHSAIVDGASIRRTIIATGHRTDASTVYEKGIPPVTAERGFARALQLMLELIPGARIVSSNESWGSDGKTKPITLSLKKLASTLGVEIKPAKVKQILNDLEFAVKPKGKDAFVVTPPLHRIGDIHGEHDLVEEVGRIYGYQTIESTMPMASTKPPLRDTRLNNVRDALKEERFFETLHLAFTNADELSKFGMDANHALAIKNPLGEESGLMRMRLLPALLKTASQQMLNTRAELLKFYEVGHIFDKKCEEQVLALLVAAKAATTLVSDPLLVVKQAITHALQAAGYTVSMRQFEEKQASCMHPGRAGDIVLDDGIVVGKIFEIHPKVAGAFGLHERNAAAVVYWDMLMPIPSKRESFKKLPAFPAVAYDETLSMGKVVMGDVLTAIRSLDPLLTELEVIDYYEGNGIKNVTLHFVYRASDRTLEQKETDAVHAKVLAELKKKLG